MEIIRIVLVSPSDVSRERELAKQVVTDLNEHLLRPLDMQIELTRWEDIPPGLHQLGAQGQIDAHLSISDSDYVVGVFWRRFGTPTDSGERGTEHEVRTAYEAWRDQQKPQVMLYFSKQAYAPSTIEETEQWGRVLQFKNEFLPKGLVHEYSGAENFAVVFRNHLMRLIGARMSAHTAVSLPCAVCSSQGRVRREGITEPIGNVVLVFPSSPNIEQLTVSIKITFNTNITNRLTPDGYLSGVLLVSETPMSVNYKHVRAKLLSVNQAVFENAVLLVGGPVGSRYQITGLRANASLLHLSSADGSACISAFLAIEAGERSVMVVNPVQTVDQLSPTSFFGVRSRLTSGGHMRFSRSEGINAGYADYEGNSPTVRPPLGFYLTLDEAYSGAFTTADEESTSGTISGSALADESTGFNGIRFIARFAWIPPDVKLYVTTRDLTSVLEPPSAVLVRTDPSGNGPFSPVDSENSCAEGYQIHPLPMERGSAIAVWEWVGIHESYPTTPKSLRFGVIFSANPNPAASCGPAFVSLSLGPLSTDLIASRGSPIPRFVDTSVRLIAFEMEP